jgi:phosphomannomutase
MAMDEGLRAKVRAWIDGDPDPSARAELEALLEAGDEAELRDRFAGDLEFGTAGLRGLIGAGPRRMNRAVAARATAGLCAHLLEHVPDARERGLCVGYDGRRLSKEMAEDVAAVAAGMGLRVHRFDTTVPTPLVAFAVQHLGAAGGVMVTASHNPPAYNGYKVYWANGAQIVPPLDAQIAARIAAAAAARDLARVDAPARRDGGLEHVLGNELVDAYLAGVCDLAGPSHPGRAALSIAHTSLHGVGAPYLREAMRRSGFAQLHEVPEQAEPDPAFPTVAFPNPEEPGSMDRVLALARERDAHLVLANDPDADRLAVAVRDRNGEHVALTGNEIGCLLGDWVLSHGTGDRRLVVATIVSSPLLGAIAESYGARFEQTLTGFKWIAHRAMELEREGWHFAFGYEEALGYCAGTLVRDKDGISTALLMAELAAHCLAEGRTVLDVLEALARRHGLFMSRQVSLTDPERGGLERITRMSARARQRPPRALGGLDVVAVEDVLHGTRERGGPVPSRLGLPPSDLLVLELEGGHRAMLRPSGTEPKLKYYVDVRVPMAGGEPLAAAQSRGDALLSAVVADLRAHVEAD